MVLSGFGRWSVREKKARKGRNPKTGEQMTIHDPEGRELPVLKQAKANDEGGLLRGRLQLKGESRHDGGLSI